MSANPTSMLPAIVPKSALMGSVAKAISDRLGPVTACRSGNQRPLALSATRANIPGMSHSDTCGRGQRVHGSLCNVNECRSLSRHVVDGYAAITVRLTKCWQ